MTIKEMQYRFGIHLNQFGEGLKLNSDDIEYWLNKGQLDLIKNKYNGLNQEQRGFEQSQQRIDDLRVLIKRGYEINISYVNTDNDDFYIDRGEFPNDHLFLISSKSQVRYNRPEISFIVTNNKRVSSTYTQRLSKNRFSQSDDIYTLLEDPFNTTKPESPLLVIGDKYIYAYTNKEFIINKIFIDYLRIPNRMSIKGNISSELPEHLHEDIIQRAADLFLNNTRQLKQRLQRETPTSNQELNEQNDE